MEKWIRFFVIDQKFGIAGFYSYEKAGQFLRKLINAVEKKKIWLKNQIII